MFTATVALFVMAVSGVCTGYPVHFTGQLNFTSFDGTLLFWNAYFPDVSSPPIADPFSAHGGKKVDGTEAGGAAVLPLVVCPNSWGESENEYKTRLIPLAAAGYIAVEYETRGWHNSTGLINAAGPLDRRDASAFLTFLIANAPNVFGGATVKSDGIAFLGISYGAGIALMAAGGDPRVKTAVSLSGWNSIVDFAYGEQAPNIEMCALLVADAKLSGHPSPAIDDLLDDLIHHKNISHLIQWGLDRSPDHLFLDQYIKRDVPLFISNNYIDRIFRPQFMADMVTKIVEARTGAKQQSPGGRASSSKQRFSGGKSPAAAGDPMRNLFFMMNQGIHAMVSTLGLLHKGHSHIWELAGEWLDHHLLGKNTSIVTQPHVQMQYGAVMNGSFIGFSSWPPPENQMKFETFWLRPRGSTKATKSAAGANPFEGYYGQLSASAPAANTTAQDVIHFSKIQPVLAVNPLEDIRRSMGDPQVVKLQKSDPRTSIVFVSEPFATGRTLCGVPRINAKVAPSGYASGWQLYAYLLAVDPATNATHSLAAATPAGLPDEAVMVSTAAFTRWGPSENVPNPAPIQRTKGWDMHPICQAVPAGWSVGVGFTLWDSLFTPATTKFDQKTAFMYDIDATVSLPFTDLKPSLPN